MTPPTPFFSIIISTFNCAADLEITLANLAQQTRRNFEVLISDNCSTDGTLAVAGRYADLMGYQSSKPDRGIYDAWNQVVPHCRGQWIYFLGSGDTLYAPETLEQVETALKAVGSAYRVVYGRVAKCNDAGKILEVDNQAWPTIRKKFRSMNCIHHQGVFHHTSLFSLYGLFNPDFRIAGDFDLLLRELKDHDALFLPHIIVARATLGGVSTQWRKTLAVIREFEAARRHNQIVEWSLPLWRLKATSQVKVWLFKILPEEFVYRIVDLFRALTGRSALWH